MLKKLYLGAAMVTALFLLIACGASQKNHQARLILQNSDKLDSTNYEIPDQVIRNGDLLTILIYSDNKEATEIFNQAQSGVGMGGNAAGASNISALGRGYQVDNNGDIYLHKIGTIKAAGLTKNELAAKLNNSLVEFLKEPYVTIRFANNRITVLGEVLRPGLIELPDQKISILDAIGLAGDMTPFGRRDKVLVIREINNQRTVGEVDIRTADMYKSPFFYLQQNDLVYVEPSKRKPTGNEQVLMRNVTIVTSIVSVIALVVTLLTR